MAASATPSTPAPVMLICGDDDFTVKQRAKQVYEAWTQELGGLDHEIVDASALNTDEAMKSIGRLREALNTLPFFGGAKVVWWQNCSFLGDERTAGTAAVTAELGRVAEELKNFRWDGVRLLISGGKPNRVRTFYKTLAKIGTVELFAALSAEDKEWAGKAESEALRLLKADGKDISDEALADLVNRVGPNLRALASEVEKLTLYVGARTEITLADVQLLTTRQKQAQAFALGEALGDRDLPKLLHVLDEELWEMRVDKKKSEIGLLYGLISKVRAMLLLKELRQAGLLKPARDYNSFKSQLDRLPATVLSGDKRFNPLAGHPFVAFRASQQADNYETAELVVAMESLLEANRKLVSSDADEALVLQKVLVDILGLKVRRR